MRIRIIATCIFTISFCGLVSFPAAADEYVAAIWQQNFLAPFVTEGLLQNRSLQGLAAQTAAARQEIPASAALEDPKIGFGLANLPVDTWRFDQEPMTQKQFFISQKFPWFGKLGLMEKKATLKWQRQELVLNSKKLELARQIATAYFDLAFNEKSLSINDRLTKQMKQIIGAAETSYSAGRGLQQDVLLAQVELTRLINERLELTQKNRTIINQLEELLNRKNAPPIAPLNDLDMPIIDLDSERITDEAMQNNPSLLIKLLEADEAKIDSELAEKNYWPDMDVRLTYGQRDESKTGQDWADFASATVTLNVPLWQRSRQTPQLAAARSRYEAAKLAAGNIGDNLPHRLDSLIAEIQTNQETYTLFTKGLLLQSQQAALSSITAYEVGKVEFNTMMNAQIRQLQFELQAHRYLTNIYKKWAELAELVGIPPETASLPPAVQQ